MNKKNIFYAALLLMAIGAEAKEIKGKVMADGKGLAKVVVTDGTAFALTSEDGSYMIDADEKAHFIYVVTPSGYMAPCNGGTPVFYKTLNENSHDFQLHRWGTVAVSYTHLTLPTKA